MHRPRLSERALVRMHTKDGKPQLAIHDAFDGTLRLIAPHLRRSLLALDGTRDVDALVSEYARGENAPSEEEIRALIDGLDAVGLLESEAATKSGVEAPASATRADALGDEPLSFLPGLALRCDGAGECCSSYASISLSADDVERAKKTGLPIFPEPERRGGGLPPLSGATRDDRYAMALVDGRCSALRSDGACEIHALAGAEAKPIGCRTYPLVYVHDGAALRVSISCECSCVFRSLASDAAPPVESASMQTARALPPDTTVRRLEPHVVLAGTVLASREAIAAWSASILVAGDNPYPIAMLLDQSEALRARAFAATNDPRDAPQAPMDSLRSELVAFAESVERAAETAAAWRSPRDRTVLTRRVVADAAKRACDPARLDALLDDHRSAKEEAFFVRASIYGFTIGSPLVHALARAAARLVVARELAAYPPKLSGHPIAMVEMVSRGLSG